MSYDIRVIVLNYFILMSHSVFFFFLLLWVCMFSSWFFCSLASRAALRPCPKLDHNLPPSKLNDVILFCRSLLHIGRKPKVTNRKPCILVSQDHKCRWSVPSGTGLMSMFCTLSSLNSLFLIHSHVRNCLHCIMSAHYCLQCLNGMT